MIEFPSWSERAELSRLWQLAFDDQPRAVRFSLSEQVRAQEDCLVYRRDGKIAAALYLLPASLKIAGIALSGPLYLCGGNAAGIPGQRVYGCPAGSCGTKGLGERRGLLSGSASNGSRFIASMRKRVMSFIIRLFRLPLQSRSYRT